MPGAVLGTGHTGANKKMGAIGSKLMVRERIVLNRITRESRPEYDEEVIHIGTRVKS